MQSGTTVYVSFWPYMVGFFVVYPDLTTKPTHPLLRSAKLAVQGWRRVTEIYRPNVDTRTWTLQIAWIFTFQLDDRLVNWKLTSRAKKRDISGFHQVRTPHILLCMIVTVIIITLVLANIVPTIVTLMFEWLTLHPIDNGESHHCFSLDLCNCSTTDSPLYSTHGSFNSSDISGYIMVANCK